MGAKHSKVNKQVRSSNPTLSNKNPSSSSSLARSNATDTNKNKKNLQKQKQKTSVEKTAVIQDETQQLLVENQKEKIQELQRGQIVQMQDNALNNIRSHNYHVFKHLSTNGSTSSSESNKTLCFYSDYVIVYQKASVEKNDDNHGQNGDDTADPLYIVLLLQSQPDRPDTSGTMIPRDDKGYCVQLMDGKGNLVKDKDGSTMLRSVSMYQSKLKPISEMWSDLSEQKMNYMKNYITAACEIVTDELDAANVTGCTTSKSSSRRCSNEHADDDDDNIDTNNATTAPALSKEKQESYVKTWKDELNYVKDRNAAEQPKRYYIFRTNNNDISLMKIVIEIEYDPIKDENMVTLVKCNHPVYLRLFLLESHGFMPSADGLNIVPWKNIPIYSELLNTLQEYYHSQDRDLEKYYEPKNIAFLEPYLYELVSNEFIMEPCPDITSME